MEDGRSPFKNTWHCAKHLALREGGLRGLGAGLSASMTRECIQLAAYFPCYTWVKSLLTPAGTRTSDLSVPRLMVAGATAGLAQFLPPMFAVDVLKSRMMAMPYGHYGSMLRCAVTSYREGGWRVFVRGTISSYWRAIAAHGVLLPTVEVTMRVLRPVGLPAWMGGGDEEDDL